ncbi:MAG: hypothetical protein ABIG42_02020 [bacterium]
MKNTLYYISIILVLFILNGCSGGESNPTAPPSGQQTPDPTLGAISGRLLDLEGKTMGGVFVKAQIFDENMEPITAVVNPDATGPIAGVFNFTNLPLNKTLIFKAEHEDLAVGRLIGYDQVLFFTAPGNQNLGDCVMNNEQLMLGWSSYKVKKYNLALYHFNRALNTRYADALSQSSSAFTAIGWVYAKRGQDTTTSGPSNRGFEWTDALSNWDVSIANHSDADAYVGMAGTYMTLVANSILLDPVQYGGKMFIYGFTESYNDDALDALDKALVADPDYDSAHDIITADDLRACQLYNRYITGEQILQNEIDQLIVSNDLNVGSLQLLTSLANLIEFDASNQIQY